MRAKTALPLTGRTAIVIGAGLGGLATALRLAARGCRVKVLEQNRTIGGKMNRWQSAGYTFDTGPSLITMPWVFHEIFEAAGARLEEHIDLVSMRPIMEAVFADGTRFIYSNSIPDWTATLKNLDSRDVDGFYRLMRLGARLFELSKETFLRNVPTAPPDARSLRALRHFPLRHAWGNYDRAICAHLKSPYLRQLFNRYPTYVGSSPYASPATLLVIPYIEYAFGGWYVKGGLYKIVEALLKLCDATGVETYTNTAVERITVTNGAATGVLLSTGEALRADIVVMNGDAACANALLGKTVYDDHAHQRSMSGVVLLIGVGKRIRSMHHHTVYFSSDYRNEFSDIFERRRFPEEPTVYVSAPSLADRSLAPENGEALFVMANAPATGEDNWDTQLCELRSRMLGTLRRGALILDDADTVTEQIWTPQTFARRYRMPGGAIYGTHSHGWRKAFLRPSNKDKSVRGLYYVGGSTHPGGGTPTVLLSAKITSGLIEQHERA